MKHGTGLEEDTCVRDIPKQPLVSEFEGDEERYIGSSVDQEEMRDGGSLLFAAVLVPSACAAEGAAKKAGMDD